MGHIPVRVRSRAQRFFELIMLLILILPPRPNRHLNLLYSGLLLVYLAAISHWRFGFDYSVSFDRTNDFMSHFLDMFNFVALVLVHFTVSMEMLWLNRRDQIEQRLLRIRSWICEEIGHKVNVERCQRYINYVLFSFLLRVAVLLATTMYANFTATGSRLLYANFYSEVVMILRCSEFTLCSARLLNNYLELYDAALGIVSKLESRHSSSFSQRRLPLKLIYSLQELHLLIWQVQREIENNFHYSLIAGMLKYLLDTSLLPYWSYINNVYANSSMQTWCITEDIGILLQIFVPCWFCTQCDLFQRKFRSVFHALSVDRSDMQLNTALLRLSAQLEQESFHLLIGGFVEINNQWLGKFVIGVLSYTLLCIQFWNAGDLMKAELGLASNESNPQPN